VTGPCLGPPACRPDHGPPPGTCFSCSSLAPSSQASEPPGNPGRVEHGDIPRLPPDEARRPLAQTFGDVVAMVARARPLGIFLDDQQWADPSTQDLLEPLRVACERGAAPRRGGVSPGRGASTGEVPPGTRSRAGRSRATVSRRHGRPGLGAAPARSGEADQRGRRGGPFGGQPALRDRAEPGRPRKGRAGGEPDLARLDVAAREPARARHCADDGSPGGAAEACHPDGLRARRLVFPGPVRGHRGPAQHGHPRSACRARPRPAGSTCGSVRVRAARSPGGRLRQPPAVGKAPAPCPGRCGAGAAPAGAQPGGAPRARKALPARGGSGARLAMVRGGGRARSRSARAGRGHQRAGARPGLPGGGDCRRG
jgi:hypothetical protein